MLFKALPWRRVTAMEEKVVESGEPAAGVEGVGSPTEVSRPPPGMGQSIPRRGPLLCLFQRPRGCRWTHSFMSVANRPCLRIRQSTNRPSLGARQWRRKPLRMVIPTLKAKRRPWDSRVLRRTVAHSIPRRERLLSSSPLSTSPSFSSRW